jgi:hypothetical protein
MNVSRQNIYACVIPTFLFFTVNKIVLSVSISAGDASEQFPNAKKEALQQYPWKEALQQSPGNEVNRQLLGKEALQQFPRKEALQQFPKKEALQQSPEKEALQQVHMGSTCHICGQAFLDRISLARHQVEVTVEFVTFLKGQYCSGFQFLFCLEQICILHAHEMSIDFYFAIMNSR